MKFLENKKTEYFLLAAYILSIGMTATSLSFRAVPLVISFTALMLLYFLRLIISFRNWRFSRGIAVINAYLNFELMYIILAISYTLLDWPGSEILIYNAIVVPLFFLLIIGIFLMIRWSKLVKTVYWNSLKGNICKAMIGIACCLFLLYYQGMPAKFKRNAQAARVIP